MSEDIKMADVFELPLDDNGCGITDSAGKQHEGFYGCDQDSAAVHAINSHDKLTQQVAELRAALGELISKASECDSWESFPEQYLYEANEALKASE